MESIDDSKKIEGEEINIETLKKTKEALHNVLIPNTQILPLDTHVIGDSLVTISPERWATIPSLTIDGVEIFYNDPEKRNTQQESLREGFWMWPQAGPFSQEQNKELWYNLKQHGFLREEKREKVKSETKEVSYKFEANQNTLDQFPHPFICYQKIQSNEKWVRISLVVENKGNKEMQFAPGHHTYYKIRPELKKNIIFDKNIPLSEEEKEARGEGRQTIKLENPWSCKVFIPEIGTLLITFDKKFWGLRLRSQKNKWFVCIEPVVCHPNERKELAPHIATGESLEIWFSITLLSKENIIEQLQTIHY